MLPILKDLNVLIRKSTIHYRENCPQGDVILSEDFQKKHGEYLRGRDYMVDFYGYTSVITTSVGNTMYVPNQWFVVASYALGVFTELMAYKDALLKVCRYMGQRPKLCIPKMRDETASIDKRFFIEACEDVFSGNDPEAVREATNRLWRFATDYSWWSGNKTIDRGDFYLSVCLNMLGLVAVSQSYVGDIVSDYYNEKIAPMLADLSGFTENLSGKTYEIEDYRDPKESVPEIEIERQTDVDDGDEIVISVKSRE